MFRVLISANKQQVVGPSDKYNFEHNKVSNIFQPTLLIISVKNTDGLEKTTQKTYKHCGVAISQERLTGQKQNGPGIKSLGCVVCRNQCSSRPLSNSNVQTLVAAFHLFSLNPCSLALSAEEEKVGRG